MRISTLNMSSTPNKSRRSCGDALCPTHSTCSSPLSAVPQWRFSKPERRGPQSQIAPTYQIDTVPLHEHMAAAHQRWHLNDTRLRVGERDAVVQVVNG